MSELTRFRTMTSVETCLSQSSAAVVVMLKQSIRLDEDKMRQMLNHYERIRGWTRAVYIIFTTDDRIESGSSMIPLSWFDTPIQDGVIKSVFEVDARDRSAVAEILDRIFEEAGVECMN